MGVPGLLRVFCFCPLPSRVSGQALALRRKREGKLFLELAPLRGVFFSGQLNLMTRCNHGPKGTLKGRSWPDKWDSSSVTPYANLSHSNRVLSMFPSVCVCGGSTLTTCMSPEPAQCLTQVDIPEIRLGLQRSEEFLT